MAGRFLPVLRAATQPGRTAGLRAGGACLAVASASAGWRMVASVVGAGVEPASPLGDTRGVIRGRPERSADCALGGVFVTGTGVAPCLRAEGGLDHPPPVRPLGRSGYGLGRHCPFARRTDGGSLTRF